MSFALPSLKMRPSQPESFGLSQGSFGVPDLMTNGSTLARSNVEVTHPLMLSELNHHKNQTKMNMSVLRNTQGLHAPLRIAMEVKAAKKVGRLPFLPSSNVMLESLTGRDIEMEPSDIFNVAEFSEVSGQPHALVEKSLGLL